MSLRPFPHLARSICRLTHSSHSSFPRFGMLPASPSFAVFSIFVVCRRTSPPFSFSVSYLFSIHLSFADSSSAPHPSYFPLPGLIFPTRSVSPPSISLRYPLPVSADLTEMALLYLIPLDGRREGNLYPTSTPHQLLLFVFITQTCRPHSRDTLQSFNMLTRAD